MPKGPQGQKRPADVVGAAIAVARISVGDQEDDPEPEKAQSAAAELGRLGGAARARNLTAERRQEIGRKGAAKRWGGKN
jgi:general stress protein YciG